MTTRYIAPNGNDSNDGSIGSPWLTISHARTAVAAMVLAGLSEPVEVFLREGTYRITETEEFGLDDYDEVHAITYQGFPGETAIVNGNKIVGATTWNDEGGGVFSRSLPAQGAFHQLTANGEVATRARWPKEGSYHLMEKYDPLPTTGDLDWFEWDTVVGNPAAMLDLANNPKVEMVHLSDFISNRFLVSSVVAERVYTTEQNPNAGGFAWNRHYGRYWFENSRNFVTEAGEWYYDLANETLYYYPRPGEAINDTVLAIPTVTSAIAIKGEIASLPWSGDFSVGVWFRTSAVLGADFARQAWCTTITDPDQPNYGVELSIRRLNGTDNVPTIKYMGNVMSWYDFPPLNDGVWHHMLVSVDKSAQTATMWIDGVEALVPSSPQSFAGEPDPPDLGPTIGFGASYYWGGELNDLVFFDTTIPSTTVAQEIRDGDYSSIPVANRLLHAPFSSDFDLNCDTISTVVSEQVKVEHYSKPTFIDGGVGHNPCLSFDGVDDHLQTEYMPGKRVANLHLKNLSVTGVDHDEITDYWAEDTSIYEPRIDKAIKLDFARDCSVTECEVFDVAGTGIMAKGCQRITIDDNHVHHTGYCGIVVEAPSWTRPDVAQAYMDGINWEDHSIDDNMIHNVGQKTKLSFGIWLTKTSRTTANRNFIYDCPYVGIAAPLGFNPGVNSEREVWADIEIAYNTIRNCMEELCDGGAIYAVGPCVRGHIHHNHIKDIIRTPLHVGRRDLATPVGFIRAMHFDNGSTGWIVENNLFDKFASEGINLHNSAITVRNNKLIDPEETGESGCVTLNSRSQLTYTLEPPQQTEFMFPVDVQRNIYYSSSGLQAGFVEWGTGDATKTLVFAQDGYGVMDFNLYSTNIVRVKDGFGRVPFGDYPLDYLQSPRPPAGAYNWGGLEIEENSVIGDPLFVDPENGDFTLQPGSPAFPLGFVDFSVPDFPDHQTLPVGGVSMSITTKSVEFSSTGRVSVGPSSLAIGAKDVGTHFDTSIPVGPASLIITPKAVAVAGEVPEEIDGPSLPEQPVEYNYVQPGISFNYVVSET